MEILTGDCSVFNILDSFSRVVGLIHWSSISQIVATPLGSDTKNGYPLTPRKCTAGHLKQQAPGDIPCFLSGTAPQFIKNLRARSCCLNERIVATARAVLLPVTFAHTKWSRDKTRTMTAGTVVALSHRLVEKLCRVGGTVAVLKT